MLNGSKTGVTRIKHNNLEEFLKAKVMKAKARNHYRQWGDVVEHTVLVDIGLAAQCTNKSKILEDQLNFGKNPFSGNVEI